jgi:lipid II:glycine glycyltransferase (peptidoglycan interpeptide bridge formation enzyme)
MERDGPWGKIFNSLPFFGSNGGIITRSQLARSSLREQYRALTVDSSVAGATLIENPLDPMQEELVPYDMIDERIGQFTKLKNQTYGSETFPAKIDGSARRNIRRAQKAGVSVRVDNDCASFLEKTHRENMNEISGTPKSSRFFEKLAQHFQAGTDYNIYVAEHNGRMISALLLLYFNRTVEYFVPVTVKEFRTLQPMAAILFQAMSDASKHGYANWNWGGTWLSQQGVWRFKQKWGAEDLPYRYLVKLNKREILNHKPGEILSSYPGFFVVPFKYLKSET